MVTRRTRGAGWVETLSGTTLAIENTLLWNMPSSYLTDVVFSRCHSNKRLMGWYYVSYMQSQTGVCSYCFTLLKNTILPLWVILSIFFVGDHSNLWAGFSVVFFKIYDLASIAIYREEFGLYPKASPLTRNKPGEIAHRLKPLVSFVMRTKKPPTINTWRFSS